MKHFNESIAKYWGDALRNPTRNADPLYLKHKREQTRIELPFIHGAHAKIIKDAEKNLGTPIAVYGEHPLDAVKFESECIQWKNPFFEKLDFEEPKEIAETTNINGQTPDFDYETLLAYVQELPEPDFVLSQLVKILNSAKNNDEIQYEVCLYNNYHSRVYCLVDRTPRRGLFRIDCEDSRGEEKLRQPIN